MEGLQIVIHNFSKLEWTRNNWGVGAGSTNEVNWTDEITSIPAERLPTGGSHVTAAAQTTHMSSFVMDALWMRLGYGSSDGDFAVNLQQLFHMFTIGKQNEWAYYDNGWSASTPDATPHIWTFAHTKVTATPTLENTGGLIAVIIRDR